MKTQVMKYEEVNLLPLRRRFTILFLLIFFSILSKAIDLKKNDTNTIYGFSTDTVLIFTKNLLVVAKIDKERMKEIRNQAGSKHLSKIDKSILNASLYGKNTNPKYITLNTGSNSNLNIIQKDGSVISGQKLIDLENSFPENTKTILVIFMAIMFFSTILFWFYLNKENRNLKKNYYNLLEEIEATKNYSYLVENETENLKTVDADVAITKSSRVPVITDDTIKHILAKLAKFEKSQRYIKQDMSLSNLASYLGTNTKYLSEILKHHKGKKFSDYINGLRISYISDMLSKNPTYREYKISYLAESCGFSSREVFAVVFKKETGISPSDFIHNLKKDSREDPPPNIMAVPG